MVEQKFCDGCSQRQGCRELYQNLSEVKGPSVVHGVIVAFLLPIVVFIVSLMVFERILAEAAEAKGLMTVLGFLLALLTVGVYILVVKMISNRLGRGKR